MDIHTAAKKGDLSVLTSLLQKGESANKKDEYDVCVLERDWNDSVEGKEERKRRRRKRGR